MHPNWRALSTLQIPQTFCDSRFYVWNPHQQREAQNTNASEVTEFYEGVISSPETTSKFGPVEGPVILNNHPRKAPFDKSKFFKAAMKNDVETLRLFNYLKDDG